MDDRRPAGPSRASRAGAHRAPRERSWLRRVLWPAIALAAVALVTVLLVRPWAAEPSPASSGPPAEVAAAVRWAATELEPGTPVAVPDEVRADVVAAGGDEDRFVRAASGAGGGLRLVSDEPPDGALVLARFPGPQGTALTLVDPQPGRPTAEELDRRLRLSQAVLANPRAGATGRAAAVLQRGHVDARLLGLLAALVTRLEVGLADLPPARGQPDGLGSAEEPLARTAVIDRVEGAPVPADRAATERLTTFLEAQLPPYAPHTVEVTEEGVRIGFRYESAPDALVTGSAP